MSQSRYSLFAPRVRLVTELSTVNRQPSAVTGPVCRRETAPRPATIPFTEKDHLAANHRYSSDIGSGRTRTGRLSPGRLRDRRHGCRATSPARAVKLGRVNHAVRSSPAYQPNRSIGGCHRLWRSRRWTDRLRMPSPSLKPYLVNEIQGSALVFQVNCWRQVSRCQPLDVTYNPLYLDGHIFGSEEVIGTSDQTSIPNQGIPYIKLSIDDVLRNFKNAKDFPGFS